MADSVTKVSIVSPATLGQEELLDLYGAVGWSAYTREPEVLKRSIAGSHRIADARRDGKLVGLARTISDGATIVYLQDILVAPSAHRNGIGKKLLTILFDSYAGIRQQVLLTDTDPGQRAFYESLGFTEVHESEPSLRAYVRLTSAPLLTTGSDV